MTDVDICNVALGAIGAEKISTLTDGSVEADECKVWYPLARDAVLEARLWSFAKMKFAPARLVDPPPFDWSYAFSLPATVLSVRGVDDGSEAWTVPFEKVGRELHSDATALRVIAVQRLTDTSQFSPSFCVALAARLSAELAIALKENRTLYADNWKLYEAKLTEAAALDGLQGRTERVRSSRLARYR